MKKIVLAGACVYVFAAMGSQGPSMAAKTGSAATVLEFSADAVQALPGREIQTGKLFVSKSGTRFEFQKHGRPIVQVMLPGQGLVRIIFPLEHIYMEYKGKPGEIMPTAKASTPCKNSKRYTCKKLQMATINGLNAERWSITSKRPPGELRVWWDSKRKIPLRQEYSDGRIMQATLRNTRQFEGRKVENWEFVFTSPSGRFRRALSLIAPDLGLTIIEQLPNGAIRRLHNVVTGAPDAKLFEIPEGYKLVAGPMPRQINPVDKPANSPPAIQNPQNAPAGAKPSTAEVPQPPIQGLDTGGKRK